MIKLFKNIRKKLVAEGKTTNYLKYAIGEIVLVVIGILIALQINNWNQDHIVHKETKTLLRNLKLDVEADIKNLEDQQNSLRYRKEWADFILKSLDDLKATDSTKFITAITRVSWIMDYSQTFPTYNEIVSSGKLSYIKSENLKKELANYQTEVEDYRQIVSSYNLGLKETERRAIGHLNGMPIGSNLMDPSPTSLYPGISFNLNKIAEDTEFYKSVKHISFYTSVNIDFISSLLITKAEGLKNLIADELKSY
ncbi:DUF6090 family protein [Mariniflexile sp.]|uniref:DUF6090 family protein n=1 Tax=Mariniflexile sp. TaxID=1979402 RepID=UPI004048675F